MRMSTPGIEWPQLVRWIAANVPDAGEPGDISVISGGRSNLTYLIEAAERRLVLRRPPLGHVLPTAHDMSREWRVISALAETPVPVPEPIAFCADEEVIGAPFYLMGHVDGEAIRTVDGLTRFGETETRRLADRLAEILADIHAVDYQAVGLADFGRPDGYLARQLRRWNQQWERSKVRELPEYDRLVARLTERLPAESASTLVHGDYRLDNTLVGVTPEGVPEIRAVVDWEMSTLGDPMADLGVSLTYWRDRAEQGSIAVSGDATLAPGFLDAREFAAAYAKASGTDVSGLDFYLAFGNFKLAVIIEGIHARYRQGKTVGEGFENIGASVPVLVERAHRVLDGS
jgi:aminoglycoside phosphotransferase (APT) family kinase protein